MIYGSTKMLDFHFFKNSRFLMSIRERKQGILKKGTKDDKKSLVKTL